MKAVIILALISLTFVTSHEIPHITHESLQKVKSQSSFQVYSSIEEHPFKNWSFSKLQSLMGLSTKTLKDTSSLVENKSLTADLPESFDSRVQWPNCIHNIRNQGHCGSCWAHAASEVLSDRFCIASNGTVDVVLSPQDMVSCDWFDHGCNGGILTTSWVYLRFFGIVSDKCKPYSSGDGNVEWCSVTESKCADNAETYQKYKAKNFYWLTSIEAIKRDIFEHGPVETGFSVYDDFMNYKTGVYKKTAGASMLGGHAVKIVGWGKEDNTEYWIVANSWDTTWGENGYFRIAFGECGIENCIAGEANVNTSHATTPFDFLRN
jgi:cathepsin B